MKYVYLQFMLKDCGSVLQVVVTEQEAKQFIADWTSGAFKLKDKRRHSGMQPDGVVWSVDVESIVGLCMAHIQPTMQGAPSPFGMPAVRS